MNRIELEELKKVDVRTVDVSVLEEIEKIERSEEHTSELQSH